VVTSAGHNLQDGTSVIINITSGNMAADGIRVVDVIDANSFSVPVDSNNDTGTGSWQSLDIFSLDGTNGENEGPYTPGTGTWSSTYWGDKYDGMLLRGSGLLVKDVNLFYFPGTALVIHPRRRRRPRWAQAAVRSSQFAGLGLQGKPRIPRDTNRRADRRRAPLLRRRHRRRGRVGR
jgi:hypothetical protein